MAPERRGRIRQRHPPAGVNYGQGALSYIIIAMIISLASPLPPASFSLLRGSTFDLIRGLVLGLFGASLGECFAQFASRGEGDDCQ